MKVGLTTGVYDLLHRGHKNLFKKCLKKCDFLLIAVASDWLTKVQKGEARPVECEMDRCFKVNMFVVERRLNAVAFVTDLLNFNSYADFVDVLFMGEDQKNVRWDGGFEVIKRTKGISTGQIIKGMRKKHVR